MDLIRRICFCAVQGNFVVQICCITGAENEIADAPSRFQESRFLRLVPGAQPTRQALPEELSEIWASLYNANMCYHYRVSGAACFFICVLSVFTLVVDGVSGQNGKKLPNKGKLVSRDVRVISAD